MHSDKKVAFRKPYEKPLLRIIELKADEVLAVGCKTNSIATKAAGNSGPLGTCLFRRTCYDSGS